MADDGDVLERVRTSIPAVSFRVATRDLVAEGRRRRRSTRAITAVGVVAVTVAAFATPRIASPTRVAGFTVFEVDGRNMIGLTVASVDMEPTLRPGDIAAIDIDAYDDGRLPDRGDIAVFTSPVPTTCSHIFVKRVVGVAGDRVEQRDGEIVVNGNVIEGLRRDHHQDDLGPWTVDPGHVFVVGDNLDNSADSRRDAFGQVPVASIIGRVEPSIELDRADIPAQPACVAAATAASSGQ